MINASSNSTSFTPMDAGNFVARCYAMVHIGTLTEEYMGEKKRMNKVRLTFELPTELKEFKEGDGEKPTAISKEFTLSMHEKANLRKFLEGWRGKTFTDDEAKEFDITKLLGKPCMLSIIHKTTKAGKIFADVASASTLPKGLTCPDQVNKNYEWNYTDHFDPAAIETMPEFIRNKIKDSEEWKLAMNQGHEQDVIAESEPDEISDLPF